MPLCCRALTPPGFLRHLHIGVRVKEADKDKTGKLVGFITGIPANVRVYDRYSPLLSSLLSHHAISLRPLSLDRVMVTREVPMVEINFLCVHKKLRAKRLAPVLIKEITRRVNLTGVGGLCFSLSPSPSFSPPLPPSPPSLSLFLFFFLFFCLTFLFLSSTRVFSCAPLSRRVRVAGVWQAVYTAGVLLPKPVARNR